MPAMNISLQRRIGKLPKSPDYLENMTPTIFGDSHRGYGSRVPTPTAKGFFGLGGIGKAHKGPVSNEMGDGKNTAWYGNDGVRSLPPSGIYGIGSAPGEETVMMTSSMDNRPAHWETPGLFGAKSFVTQNWMPIALVAGVMVYLRK